MSRRIRRRYITAVMLIACLLFQQMAMAAYACTMPRMPANPVVMLENCEGMAAEPAQPSDAMCQKHCAPDPTSASTQVNPAVPALALPPVSFGLTMSQGTDHGVSGSGPAFARSDPPPRVRYCRLLI